MNSRIRLFLFILLASVCLLICLPSCQSQFNTGYFPSQILSDGNEVKIEHKCLCKLNGEVDDCECKIETIDKFNNYKIFPLLNALVQKDYFRYIKVNLKKKCQFWPGDDGRCALRDCHVNFCNDEDLPQDFKTYFENDQNHRKDLYDIKEFIYSVNKNDNEKNSPDLSKPQRHSIREEECDNPLGHINQTMSDENLKTFKELEKFDVSQDNFCESDDESEEAAEFADLVANPERYTGYKGAHAHKIWNSIYNENCFSDFNPVPSYGPEVETCLEKRVFYRLISGLHSSINVHLSLEYLHKGHLNQPDWWGPNIKEFKRRFNPAKTNGQGPQWLKNMYFLYLVELRAISKAIPYFETETFYAGRSVQNDLETKQAVIDFLDATKQFDSHFDETILFKGSTVENIKLKEQYQLKFRNITRIMDCVGCDKCKLWGKVQTRALGTALKILFSGKNIGPESTVNAKSKQAFQLSRVEIVALFNGFARLSTSIAGIEEVRELLDKEPVKTGDKIKMKSNEL